MTRPAILRTAPTSSLPEVTSHGTFPVGEIHFEMSHQPPTFAHTSFAGLLTVISIGMETYCGAGQVAAGAAAAGVPPCWADATPARDTASAAAAMVENSFMDVLSLESASRGLDGKVRRLDPTTPAVFSARVLTNAPERCDDCRITSG